MALLPQPLPRPAVRASRPWPCSDLIAHPTDRATAPADTANRRPGARKAAAIR